MHSAAKPYRVAAALIAACLVLVGCGDALQEPKLVKRGLSDIAESDVDLDRAKSENHNRLVDPKFTGKLEIIDDSSGIAAARTFFNDSESMVLFAPDDKSRLRAATLAISQHLPAVEYEPSRRGKILNLIGDLEVKRLVIVGDIPWTQSRGEFTVIKDPGTHEALGDFTAFQYESKVVASPEQMVKDIARLDKTPYVELRPAWIAYEGEADDQGKKLPSVPAQSRRDGQMAPNIVATAESPVANVITAAAYGGSVLVMPTADPLEDKRGMAMVAGLDEGSLIALGPEFGQVKEFKEKIRQGTPN